jgi:hypothetical protein
MDEAKQKIEDKLLEILSKEILSISELSRRLNVKRYILAGYLEALKEQGKVDVFKVGRAKVYVAKEKFKKGLWILFFLTFIPFLFPVISFAEIELNLSSEKIWILNSGGDLVFVPKNISVTTNCERILSAYLNASNVIKWISEISRNTLNFNTEVIKDLAFPAESYSLHLECKNGSEIISVSKELNVSNIIVIKDLGSGTLFEDSDIVLRFSLVENDEYVDVLKIRRENMSLSINNENRRFDPIYDLNKNEIEINLGKFSPGTYSLKLTFWYSDLPIPITISESFKVEKKLKISITSPTPPYLSPNSTIEVKVDTPIASLDTNKISVLVGGKNANFSLDGKSLRVIAPELQPGEYLLKVCYENFCDSAKVFYVAKIRGKILDDSNKPVSARFTFLKNGIQIASFLTDSSGNYNIVLPPDYYDLRIELPKSTVSIKNFKFEEKEGLVNHIYKDSISIKGIRAYGFYFFEFDGEYSSIDLELRYEKSRVEDEDRMKVFYCKNWNFAENNCNSNWEYPTFNIDKVNSRITLSLNQFSAFILGREVSLKVLCSINRKTFYVNETSLITCLVEDEDGNPINEATVTLIFDGEIKVVNTDKNGVVTVEYVVPKEGNFNVTVQAEKPPYSKARNYISFFAERKRELFISFPDLIKAEIGRNLSIDFSIVNTGQSDINSIKIYIENLPFEYALSLEQINKVSPNERVNISLSTFIPENSTITTYSPRIKVISREIEASKDFGLTLIKVERQKPQTGFVIKAPSIEVEPTYIYLAIFAVISVTLAYVLKRVKKERSKKISYEDIFNLLGGGK